MKRKMITALLLASMAVIFICASKNQITEKDYGNTEVPVLKIVTVNHKEVSSKHSYKKANFEAGNLSGKCRIRGHGNTTWETREVIKKPYLLKLNDSASLFGLPAGKKWILLANTTDKSLMRNRYAEHLYSKIWNNGLWHPESILVNLVMNGKYMGLYMLTEKIEMGNGRLDKVCGKDSFLVCVNSRMDKVYNFKTERGFSFSVRSPKKDHETYMKWEEEIQSLEDRIYSGLDFSETELGKFIDLDSFTDWFLANDFAKNHDARFQASCFLYYDSASKKFFMGPAWDFDLAFGNISWDGCENPEGFHVNSSGWFKKLWENEKFRNSVKERYLEALPKLKEHSSWLENEVHEYENAIKLNSRIWHSFGKKQWPHAPDWRKRKSYRAELEYLDGWIEKRIDWYTKEMEKMQLISVPQNSGKKKNIM